MKIQKQRWLVNMSSLSAAPSLRFLIICWFCWQSSESLSVSSILPWQQTNRAPHRHRLTIPTRNTIDFRTLLSRHAPDSRRHPSYPSTFITKIRKRRRPQRCDATTKSGTWRTIVTLAWWQKLLLFHTNRQQLMRKLVPKTTSVLALVLFCCTVQPQSAWAAVARTTSTVAGTTAAAAATATTVVPASVVISRQFEVQLCARLLYSVLMGSLVGWERSAANHSAGVRTMSLVSLGAAAFALLSIFGFEGCAHYDPSRMAANVASGVGFIGAGVITTQNLGSNPQSKEPNSIVNGLTTAAAIWISAAVGLASGLGLYYIAGIASIITVSILRIGRCKHFKWGQQMCQFVGIDPFLANDEYRTAPPLSSSALSQRTMQMDGSGQLKLRSSSFVPTTTTTTTTKASSHRYQLPQENADPSVRMTQLDKQRKLRTNDRRRCQYLEHPFHIQTTTATTRSNTTNKDVSSNQVKRLTPPSLPDVKKSSRRMRKDLKKDSLLSSSSSSSSISETKQLQDVEQDYLSAVDISSASSSSSSSLGFDDDTSLALLPSPDGCIPNLLSSASEQVERIVTNPGQNATENSAHATLGRSSTTYNNLAA